jgi:hypothetical protein
MGFPGAAKPFSRQYAPPLRGLKVDFKGVILLSAVSVGVGFRIRDPGRPLSIPIEAREPERP